MTYFLRPRLLCLLLIFSVISPQSFADWKRCQKFLRRAGFATLIGGSVSAVGYGLFENQQSDPIRRVWSTDPDRIHLALVGDSIGTDFSYTFFPKVLFRLRTTHSGGWLVDRNPGDGRGSLSDLCSGIGKTDCYATVGAWISATRGVSSWSGTALHFFGRISDVPAQVTDLLRQKDLPDVVLVSAGHNDADIVYAHREQGSDLEQLVETVPSQITTALEIQLVRLTEEAIHRKKEMRIGVLGMIDFGSAIDVRREVLRLHKEQGLYPELDMAIEGFPTLMPEFASVGESVSDRVDEQWRRLIDRLNQRYAGIGISFRYLDALHGLSLSVEDVSAEDGLHLSEQGHARVAQRVSAEIEDWLAP